MTGRRSLLLVAGLVLALALAVSGVFLRWKMEEPHRRYDRLAQIELQLCLGLSTAAAQTDACLDQYVRTLDAWERG